jgi:hypothetical protein
MADLSTLSDEQLLQLLQQHPDVGAMASQQGLLPPPAPPTFRQKMMANPVGQAMGGAMQGVYGLDQDIYKGGAAITSLGGYTPNPVSNYLNNAGDQMGNLASQSTQSYEGARDATGTVGANPGKFIGEIASPANMAASEVELPAAGISALGKVGKLANALLKGSAYGSTAPVDPSQDYTTEKAKQLGLGAALGVGGHALASMANPSLSPDVRTLLAARVPLTVGQTLGGTARTLEDSATSIPFVGDIVKARQRDAIAGLNSAVINRSLAPVGEKLPNGLTGHSAIQYAQEKLGNAYDSLLPTMSATQDQQLAQDMTDLVNNGVRDYGLNASKQQQLASIISSQVNKSAKGFYDGDTLKDIQSNLSYQARNFAKSSDPDQRNLSDALFDARDTFNDFIARQNPAQAPQLKAINTGYANYARAEGAADKSITGMFTPAQLGKAVKGGGTRYTNAAGNSLMQDLSTAGQSVLPATVPDSGTAGRHMVGLLAAALAGGGEHMATGDTGLGVLSTGAGLSLGATKPVQALLRGAITKRPYGPQTAAQIGSLLRNGAPALSAALLPALTQNSN